MYNFAGNSFAVEVDLYMFIGKGQSSKSIF